MKLKLFIIFTLILILFTQLLKCLSHITYMFVFILHIKINWNEKG